jgi:hypothetical protein
MTITVRAASLAALASVACCSRAAAAPSIESVPARVTPGQTLTLQVSGFAPDERVQVELQPTADELSNGDAILAASAVLVPPDGSGAISFVWPSGYYAPCTVACPRLPDSPWLPHQEVDIDVVGEGDVEEQIGYPTAKIAIALAGGSKRCGHLGVAPHPPKAKVRVVHGHLSCVAARALLRHAFPTVHHARHVAETDTLGWIWRVGGWLCSGGLGQSEIFCFRGAEQVDGSGRSDDGWLF